METQKVESPIQTLGRIADMVKGVFNAAIGRGQLKSVDEAQAVVAGFEMLRQGMDALRQVELAVSAREQKAAEARAKAEQQLRDAQDAEIDNMAAGKIHSTVSDPLPPLPPPLKIVRGEDKKGE
jgi:hypothetical protein